jgi:hypothetical protein
MTDYRFGYNDSQKPHRDGFAITPSDTVDLPYTASSIWVGGVGNVTLVTPYGTALTFTAVPAGTLLPFCATRVMATGTTATLLVAGY